jgi:hypothetical protein
VSPQIHKSGEWAHNSMKNASFVNRAGERSTGTPTSANPCFKEGCFGGAAAWIAVCSGFSAKTGGRATRAGTQKMQARKKSLQFLRACLRFAAK